MKRVEILSEPGLLTLVAEINNSGRGVTLCRDGEPIADLVPHRTGIWYEGHPILGQIVMHEDPATPFTKEEWPDPS